MRLKRVVNRIITDEYLDLYILAATSLAVAALGVLGIANVKTLASLTLALLAVLAYSQIRSRRHVSEIAKAQNVDPLSIFRTTFPEDLIRRRATATSLLLIGLTMTRTVQAGSLIDMRQTLRSGGKIRILVVDPTNDELITAVAMPGPGMNPDQVRRRIQGTLDELTDLQSSTGGDLEIRVASFIPPIGLNVIDADTADGFIVAQHYEHRAIAEAAPIFCLTPTDGMWYERFAAEALRLWEDGTPWPLSATQKLARSPRPRFQSAFGPELESSMKEARDLLITGVTRNTLVTSNYNKFEEWLQHGCRIRIILLDPASDAVTAAAERYYAERSPDVVRERVRHTLRLLAELKSSTGGTISVRLTTHPLATGIVAVDGGSTIRSDASALFVEYYTYQARGEPKFVLQPRDGEWFENFLGETEALWANSADYILSKPPPGSHWDHVASQVAVGSERRYHPAIRSERCPGSVRSNLVGHQARPRADICGYRVFRPKKSEGAILLIPAFCLNSAYEDLIEAVTETAPRQIAE